MANTENIVLEKKRSTVRFEPDIKAALRRMAAEQTNESGETVTIDHLVNTACRHWMEHNCPTQITDHRLVEAFRLFLLRSDGDTSKRVLNTIYTSLQDSQQKGTKRRGKTV